MKTKWIVIILLIVVAGVLFYLNSKGIIHWQALTILAAALLGPFRYIASLFGNGQKDIDEINARHEATRLKEQKYQQEVAAELKKRDDAIAKLDANQKVLNEKLKSLEEQKKTIAAEVSGMTVEEKTKEAKDLFGN